MLIFQTFLYLQQSKSVIFSYSSTILSLGCQKLEKSDKSFLHKIAMQKRNQKACKKVRASLNPLSPL